MRLAVVLTLLLLPACGHSRRDETRDDRRGAAYEAGRAAREIAKESAKAAKAAGREIKHGAREAHEGWKDQSRADREKGKP